MESTLAPPTNTPGTPLQHDGRSFLLRPLHAGDEERLLEFFRSHTPDTVRDRYGYLLKVMTPERARELTDVDPNRDCALGMFEEEFGREVLLAVGRYCMDPGGASAETAFVVRESLRNRGIATALLRELIRIALKRGLRSLWAQVGVENGAMMTVLRRHGFEVTSLEPMETVRLELRLGGRQASPVPARWRHLDSVRT